MTERAKEAREALDQWSRDRRIGSFFESPALRQLGRIAAAAELASRTGRSNERVDLNMNSAEEDERAYRENFGRELRESMTKLEQFDAAKARCFFSCCIVSIFHCLPE